MTEKDIILIEEEVLSLANKHLETWRKTFHEINVDIEQISISRHGKGNKYFSEIEFNLWKNNDLESVFSVIIFMEGKQALNLGELNQILDAEFKTSLNEFK
jgi:hypothetical protein